PQQHLAPAPAPSTEHQAPSTLPGTSIAFPHPSIGDEETTCIAHLQSLGWFLRSVRLWRRRAAAGAVKKPAVPARLRRAPRQALLRTSRWCRTCRAASGEWPPAITATFATAPSTPSPPATSKTFASSRR